MNKRIVGLKKCAFLVLINISKMPADTAEGIYTPSKSISKWLVSPDQFANLIGKKCPLIAAWHNEWNLASFLVHWHLYFFFCERHVPVYWALFNWTVWSSYSCVLVPYKLKKWVPCHTCCKLLFQVIFCLLILYKVFLQCFLVEIASSQVLKDE